MENRINISDDDNDCDENVADSGEQHYCDVSHDDGERSMREFESEVCPPDEWSLVTKSTDVLSADDISPSNQSSGSNVNTSEVCEEELPVDDSNKCDKGSSKSLC